MPVRLLMSFLLAMLIAACGSGGGSGGDGSTATSQAPVITSQPADVSVYEGSAATFDVGATGSAPLSYQWKKNGAEIMGAIAASYTTPMTALSDSASAYSVIVTNAAGSVTSNSAVLTVTPDPSIRTQPVSVSVTAGNTATFSVAVSGTSPFTYQWKKNGTSINAATSASYTTPVAALSDSGSTFSVTVRNAVGSVTSNAATLTVGAAPVAPTITSQPVNTTVSVASTATFSVGASGTAPLSYQWKKNGSNIVGATSTSYTTPSTALADNGGVFAVIVTNAAGSATSNNATLTVSAPPSITGQPANASVTAGNTATFSVAVSGTSPFTYQWKKNGTSINAATSASYTTPVAALSDSGSTFSVTVRNAVGSVTSNAATLTVGAAPVAPTITSQPVNTTVSVASTATFSVGASGTAPLSYQWKKNGSNIVGATSASYTTPSTALADNGGAFSVIVTNAAASATSNNATLTVSPLTAVCNGVNCGAANPNTYSGAGIGVWKYDNTSNSSSSINLSIAGVSAGKQVTLAFANGQESAASSVPILGTAVSAIGAVNSDPRMNIFAPSKPSYVAQHEDTHNRILQLNREAVRLLKTSGQNSRANTAVLAGPPRFTPAVGATRDWFETGFSGEKHPSTNKYVCALPNGRNLVFWQSNSDSGLTSTLLGNFTTSACGAGKGFDKLMGLIGDAWGNHQYNNLIADTAGKQDINIVFLSAPGAGWAGYFWGRNNFLSSTYADSNQALVFFVNTDGIAGDVNFYISTLIHEAKHMIGFYQEAVVRGKDVETWYEETSAMMSEDIVSASVTGTNKIAQYRIPTYMSTGGNISLNNWPSLSGNHYGMGGALGAFLNRRYGTKLFQDSITACTSGTAQTSSYACLDQLILSYGGLGLADELARMGASVFSKAPGSGLPQGYGYPLTVSNGYTLSAIDLLNSSVGSTPTLSTYTSMTQTQVTQIVGTGVTQYQRNNVEVPGKTTLYVVVR